MTEDPSITALIIEQDAEIIGALKPLFAKRGFAVIDCPAAEEGLRILKGNNIPLALAGKGNEGTPPLELMRRIVMQSPMTSLILISDFSEEDLHEKAEGYGILGNISRRDPTGGLDQLLDQFADIYKALHPRS